MGTPDSIRVLSDIQQHGDHARLDQQLQWLDALALALTTEGHALAEHNAYTADAIARLGQNFDRLLDSPLATFLNDKLKRTLRSAAAEQASPLIINTSFVLGTVADMFDDPEQPFEVAALMFESQSMFDEWYDQLLALAGLQRRLD